MMRLLEQADRTGDEFTYSWLLDGLSGRAGLPTQWKWVRGRPGCWVTNDWHAALSLARNAGLEILSNGTHEVHGAPGKLVSVIPSDFPVKVLQPGEPASDKCTCGYCGRSWDDAIVTGWTPAPSGRCPFEYYH